MRYSAERKEAVLKKMLPPNNRSIREIAEEEGISEATLYNWRKAPRNTRPARCWVSVPGPINAGPMTAA